jgi:hypothetical protein
MLRGDVIGVERDCSFSIRGWGRCSKSESLKGVSQTIIALCFEIFMNGHQGVHQLPPLLLKRLFFSCCFIFFDLFFMKGALFYYRVRILDICMSQGPVCTPSKAMLDTELQVLCKQAIQIRLVAINN